MPKGTRVDRNQEEGDIHEPAVDASVYSGKTAQFRVEFQPR